MLILHGYPYNSYDWALVWEALTSQFTVILPDMLGMGFSDKPHNHHYSYEEHVALYCALLKMLNVSEAHVLAHDLGNSVVQEMIALEAEDKLPVILKSIAFLNGSFLWMFINLV
ncbi:MAG: alpha/beta fold hydrolase [Cytophagales bacterium]|nr:alpha/beta fold hydrolase [Cytophagales bacterium]